MHPTITLAAVHDGIAVARARWLATVEARTLGEAGHADVCRTAWDLHVALCQLDRRAGWPPPSRPHAGADLVAA